MDRDTQLKILWLQLVGRTPHFMTTVRGKLAKKGRGKNRKYNKVNLPKQFAKDAGRLGWKAVPRAKVAVWLNFHVNQQNPPDLHNLAKCYLDYLHPAVFGDDRQIGYLEAHCRRIPATLTGTSGEDRLYIRVVQLRDYNRRVNAYFKLLELEGFRQFLREHDVCTNVYEIDNDGDRDWISFGDLHYFQDEESRKQMREFIAKQIQERVLSLSSITEYDYPKNILNVLPQHIWGGSHGDAPFSARLGNLPGIGDSGKFDDEIKSYLTKLEQTFAVFGKFAVPIDVDVQVVPNSSLSRTDLDNIMYKKIGPLLSKTLLEKGGYLQAYRIYETSGSHLNNKPFAGEVNLKIMKADTIANTTHRTDNILKLAKDWLYNQI